MAVWRGLTNSCEKKRSEKQRKKGKIYPFECRVPKKIARRENKAFLRDQCKEIEENNRLERLDMSSRKIRDTKGKFHTKIGTIKDRKGMDLIEQKILRRCGKNTQKVCKKDLRFSSVQSLSHVRLFATPWITARQASLSITNSRSSLKLTSIESVMPSSHLILCCTLLLLSPIPPSIRIFSNESTLHMRWPKYWSFIFSKFLVEFSCEAIWSWAFVRWKISDYSFHFCACDGSVKIFYFFLVQFWKVILSENLSISSKLSILLAYSCW